MAVKIATEQGLEYVLNPSFRPEGVPLQLTLGGIRAEGRDDEDVHPGLIRELPREIAVPGHIYGPDRTSVRQQVDEILAILHDGQDLRLYLDEGDARYYRVRLVSWPHVFVEGASQAAVAVRLGFRALDPYAVGEDLVATGGPGQYAVENPGDVEAEPVYTLTISAPVTGLQLVLDTIGRALDLGDAGAGDVVTIDAGENRGILRTGAPLAAPAWFHVLGFPLAPGPNALTVSVATGNVADVALSVAGNARYF